MKEHLSGLSIIFDGRIKFGIRFDKFEIAPDENQTIYIVARDREGQPVPQMNGRPGRSQIEVEAVPVAQFPFLQVY